MNKITAQEYFEECRAIAKELLTECESDEQFYDRLHETVDNHQWIIYTYYNLQVLGHSKNENAYFDEVGTLTAADFASCMSQLAFSAFQADVQEYVEEFRNEKQG